MNNIFVLLGLFASAPLAAMENGSPGFSNGVKHEFLSLQALAARQILKKYTDLEYINTLNMRLPAELITCLRLEWVKLRCLDKKFYKGYHEGRAFHIVAHFGLSDVIPLLYKNGGCLYVDYNEDGTTPLITAVWQGHLETVSVLLSLRLRRCIDMIDELKHTALYYAAQAKNKEMVKLLLEHGAKVHILRYGTPIPTPFEGLGEAWPAREYGEDKDRKEIIVMLKKAEFEQGN